MCFNHPAPAVVNTGELIMSACVPLPLFRSLALFLPLSFNLSLVALVSPPLALCQFSMLSLPVPASTVESGERRHTRSFSRVCKQLHFPPKLAPLSRVNTQTQLLSCRAVLPFAPSSSASGYTRHTLPPTGHSGQHSWVEQVSRQASRQSGREASIY